MLRFGGVPELMLYALSFCVMAVEEEDNTKEHQDEKDEDSGRCWYCRMRTLLMMIIFIDDESSLDNGNEHYDDDADADADDENATIRTTTTELSYCIDIDRHR